MSQSADQQLRFFVLSAGGEGVHGGADRQGGDRGNSGGGRWSASGSNRQPWDVVVVRDAAVKQKFGEWGARPAATADVVLLLVTAGPQSAFDEGRLAERLCLAAAAHGLGSTVATLKNEGPDETKKLLGIPEDRRVVTVVAIGHTDVEARRARPKSAQPRKPMDDFAHWDRF